LFHFHERAASAALSFERRDIPNVLDTPSAPMHRHAAHLRASSPAQQLERPQRRGAGGDVAAETTRPTGAFYL